MNTPCCEKCYGSISGLQWWCNDTSCPCHLPSKEVSKCNQCFHELCKVCKCCHNLDCEFSNKHPIKACFDQLIPSVESNNQFKNNEKRTDDDSISSLDKEKWNENAETCSNCGIDWKKIGKSCFVCFSPAESHPSKEECGCVEIDKPYPKYCAKHLKEHIVLNKEEWWIKEFDDLNEEMMWVAEEEVDDVKQFISKVAKEERERIVKGIEKLSKGCMVDGYYCRVVEELEIINLINPKEN